MSEIKVGDLIKPYGFIQRRGEDIYIFCNGKRKAIVEYCLPETEDSQSDDVIFFTFLDGAIKHMWRAHRKQCGKPVRRIECYDCGGKGMLDEDNQIECPKCNGSGKVKI